MKSLKLKYSLLVAVCIVFYACRKDHTNMDLISLPHLTVDTVGQKTSFEVRQNLDEVTIDPKIVGNTTTDSQTYLWRIYAEDTGFSDTLSNEKTFKQTIKKAPGTYTLEFQAKQSNGVKSFMRYNVTVAKKLPYGWVVVYETPEGTTDLGYFRTSEIVKNLTSDVVLKDLYKAANGSAFPGPPLAIGINGVNVFLYSTKEAAGLYDSDFSKIISFSTLFVGAPPSEPNIQGIFGSTNFQLINNGKVYFMDNNIYLGQVVVDNKGYQVDPTGGIASGGARTGIFFDILNKRFINLGQFVVTGTTFIDANAGARFSLNSINKRLIYGDQSAPGFSNANKVTIFEDLDKSKRWLYGINFNTPATPDRFLIDMSVMPNILQAKYFELSKLGEAIAPIGFYATESQIYNYNYSIADNSILYTRAGFTAPAGESITAMKLFRDNGSGGYTATDTRSNRLLFVATWNEAAKNGKVYLIQVNGTSGDMTTTPLKVIEGFGKIKDMALKPS
ncbi:PKD-like family lipoprotein [Pedobacter deserti]|uniref:PKD-like family lipoprotein n=1 Tax=Pedobacter deserti TaxID=2817382 RepID=UPI00210D5D35|nr:PKD-like family lipoprotein [Pedobacter sp. SYSU D00382]